MKKITTLLLALLLVIPAMAQTSIYLTPNSNWVLGDAWFAMYTWNNSGNKWFKMTPVEGETNLYVAELPAGYTNIIFCRMNPSSNALDWSAKWDQTNDLTYTGNNHFTVKAGDWNNASGTWSMYSPGEPAVTLSYSPTMVYVGDVVTFSAEAQDCGNNPTFVYYVDDTKLASNTWTATAEGEYTAKVEAVVNSTVKAIGTQIITVREKDALYIRGIAGNWSNGIKMDRNGYIYTWTGDITNGTGFKFTEDATSWNVQYSLEGETVVLEQECKLFSCSGNIIWGGEDDNVTITVDLTDKENVTMVVTSNTGKKPEGTDPSTETLTYNVTVPAGTPACYIAGEMNDWGFTAMTMVDETHYTITLDNVTRAMKYKYTYGESWENVEMQADGVNDVSDRTYSENDVVAAWKGIATEEPILETLTYNVTVPAGTPACYIAGEMNDWGFTAMTMVDETHYTITLDNVTRAMKYKYTYGESWENVEMQADGVNDVSDRTYSENDVVAAWKGLVASYEENIVRGAMYYMHPSDEWKSDNAWFAAYFFNKNNGNFCWVQGEMLDNGYVAFYLPAVTRAETDFTHVIFTRMNPNFNTLEWDAENEPEETLNVWNQTGDLTYPGYGNAYEINGWESEDNTGNWIDISSAVDRVEVAGGIVYANGVVVAEGAIEVYNVGGAIVARGNDNVDLRALNAGVYIVRNGNQVRKVVR